MYTKLWWGNEKKGWVLYFLIFFIVKLILTVDFQIHLKSDALERSSCHKVIFKKKKNKSLEIQRKIQFQFQHNIICKFIYKWSVLMPTSPMASSTLSRIEFLLTTSHVSESFVYVVKLL